MNRCPNCAAHFTFANRETPEGVCEQCAEYSARFGPGTRRRKKRESYLTYDPTPEEIKREAAAIRAEWSEAEERRRRTDGTGRRVELREFRDPRV